MPKDTVKKQKAISAETKKSLCIYKRDHPTSTAKEVIAKFGLDADRSTVTKILKESERWLKKDTSGNAGQLTKKRKETFVKVNEALSAWVTGALAANHIINDKILQLKACEFANHFPEEEHFKASDGWLEGFKKRNNLR